MRRIMNRDTLCEIGHVPGRGRGRPSPLLSVSLVRVLFVWIVPLLDFKGFFPSPRTRSKVTRGRSSCQCRYAEQLDRCQVAATLPRVRLERAGLGGLG